MERLVNEHIVSFLALGSVDYKMQDELDTSKFDISSDDVDPPGVYQSMSRHDHRPNWQNLSMCARLIARRRSSKAILPQSDVSRLKGIIGYSMGNK